MKDFSEYSNSINDIKIRSGKIIFQKQLEGLEGRDILINKTSTRGLIMNHLNPLNENKEEEQLSVTIETPLHGGDYITFETETNGKETYMVIGHIDDHICYKTCKMRFCNQTLMSEFQEEPIPCIADNTSYGTRGLKDNKLFIEADARLRVFVQKTLETNKYYEGMRFIFNHKTAYKVDKIDDVVPNGYYVVEMELCDITPGYDDLKNNIAYNKSSNGNESNIKNDNQTYQIQGNEEIQIGNLETYKIVPNNLNVTYKIDDETIAKIIEQSNGICKIKGLTANYFKLSAYENDKEIANMDIMTY